VVVVAVLLGQALVSTVVLVAVLQVPPIGDLAILHQLHHHKVIMVELALAAQHGMVAVAVAELRQ
jgi:hypothetical protein